MKLARLLIIATAVLLPSIGMTRDEAAPDMEMLEFLGGFETAGGKPLDPLALTDLPATTKKSELTDADKKHTKRVKKPRNQGQKEQTDEKLR